MKIILKYDLQMYNYSMLNRLLTFRHTHTHTAALYFKCDRAGIEPVTSVKQAANIKHSSRMMA